MKTYKKLLCVVALAIGIGTVAYAKTPNNSKTSGKEAVATSSIRPLLVNGKINISVAEQEAMISSLVKQGKERTVQLEDQVRYALVQDAVLSQAARNQGIHKRADVQNAIKKLTDQVLVRVLISDYLKKHPVTEKDIRTLYNQQKEQWGSTEVKVRHILLKDEETAKKILSRIQNGEKFEKLAMTQSLDLEKNRKAGGLIDWISPNMLGPELRAALSVMNPGQLANAPLKSQHGWHVLKLEERRDALRWKDYDANKGDLTQIIRARRTQAFIQETIQKAKIEVLPSTQKKTK